MWITTKKIVKEMQEEQRELAEKVASMEKVIQVVSNNTQEYSGLISNKLIVLENMTKDLHGAIEAGSERNASMVQTLTELIRVSQTQIMGEMKEEISELKTFLTAQTLEKQEKLQAIIVEKNLEIIKNILEKLDQQNVISKEIQTEIIQLLSERSDSVLECIEHTNSEAQDLFAEEIQKVSKTMGETISKENGKKIQSINQSNNDIVKRLSDINNDYLQILDNMAQVDSSLKQVVDYLLALDEGNRLIIAKMLLGEMKI